MACHITAGTPHPMGAVPRDDGVNFAVFSAHAHRIELCLFSADGSKEEQRLVLPERTGDIWHGFVPGLKPGAAYGYRVCGPYAPEQGHRFNPHKLLMDPYTRELRGAWQNGPQLLGYDATAANEDLSFDTRDSAPFVPKSVVPDLAFFRTDASHLHRPWDETVIYEAHVKGLTQLHPDVSDALRGTYEGLASDAVIDHLQRLGITAIELLPVHAFLNDAFLLRKGLTNYWGYNTVGFFAPEPRYFGPQGYAGFRDMVRRFHAAGIEVILDVVYNHTAEGDQRGPTLSFRGLDNASYYRLRQGQPRFYVNDTGTGNTVNVSSPHVLRLVMDSLRFWAGTMGVDGFRFDLGTTLGREDQGFDPSGGFFDALRQDPLLAGVKLIAEPWDIGPGGYRLGGFPAPFTEWNDAWRDTARRFWKQDAHAAQELGARLTGSADRFDHSGRRAWSSVNFLAAHDGFTLADVTAYNRRHNEANGENNRDGHHGNHSDNCGVEGPTGDPDILARRGLRQRNMLATLFLSQGTPMLLAGDEAGHSQNGNNNAYCQDNTVTWIDWANAEPDLTAFVAGLAAFRRAHPVLRQSRFLHGDTRDTDGLPDISWFDTDAQALNWRDPGLSELCVVLRGSADAPKEADTDDMVHVALINSDGVAEVTLPPLPDGLCWYRGLSTAAEDAFVRQPAQSGTFTVVGPVVVAHFAAPETGG
ncbi:glycogen debranching protein GlgX [uncultured Roseobacter sp.]|uniref:glycogen debranching protein GlgX n=1 Tax=uncultured Roseobacter sp. TaxID=114847 RepID=UPI00260F7744|nr:glycogen debranching protein GlgX [uncultured Roseobacter sp.]